MLKKTVTERKPWRSFHEGSPGFKLSYANHVGKRVAWNRPQDGVRITNCRGCRQLLVDVAEHIVMCDACYAVHRAKRKAKRKTARYGELRVIVRAADNASAALLRAEESLEYMLADIDPLQGARERR